MSKLIILFLLLTSCSKNPGSPFSGINAEFIQYVELYNKIKFEETGHTVGYYPMQFGELDNDSMLAKATIQNNDCWITVSEFYWKRFSENSKKELIFHELLHCDYIGGKHINGTIMDAIHTLTLHPEQDLRFIFRNY